MIASRLSRNLGGKLIECRRGGNQLARFRLRRKITVACVLGHRPWPGRPQVCGEQWLAEREVEVDRPGWV